MRRRTLHDAILLFCVALAVWADPAPAHMPILDYIRQTWGVLTRSHRELAAAAADPKLHDLVDGRWPVYVPRSENFPRIEQDLKAQMLATDLAKIDLRVLPADGANISPHGLLYLPKPYVVPGGRFNEMYGWDSFFIQMGLLRDGNFELAKDIADNFLYEVREYGQVLNANRTYYLTRSQPPFLTQMVLAVYSHTKDKKWLEDAVPAVERYYRYWTEGPHATVETGLSRYFDSGNGPAPEVVASERDSKGRGDYDLIRAYFRSHKVPDYDITQYYDAKRDTLTDLFYQGDRSMRESGFDPSNRFGPFSIDIIHYNPVCLNTLLYLMESQTAEIMGILQRSGDAETWKKRAEQRAQTINRLLWNAADGLYYDYNFERKQIRRYPFLTTFYPLWAGIASPAQAAAVVKNLHRFERTGGLQTSDSKTGDQWDAPFGWAPLQWIAVEGLRRYGYNADADRIAAKFLTMVAREYARHGDMEEKYDVVRGSDDVDKNLRYGYHSNEAGFGWTNAVFTALLDKLPLDQQAKILALH